MFSRAFAGTAAFAAANVGLAGAPRYVGKHRERCFCKKIRCFQKRPCIRVQARAGGADAHQFQARRRGARSQDNLPGESGRMGTILLFNAGCFVRSPFYNSQSPIENFKWGWEHKKTQNSSNSNIPDYGSTHHHSSIPDKGRL